MELKKVAGRKIKMIVLCDEDGFTGRFSDGQKLAKKCEGYINEIFPQEGEVGHDHQDWVEPEKQDVEEAANQDVRKKKQERTN